jgi:hypothetical protein
VLELGRESALEMEMALEKGLAMEREMAMEKEKAIVLVGPVEEIRMTSLKNSKTKRMLSKNT